MRISDWSSDVCSSDLAGRPRQGRAAAAVRLRRLREPAGRRGRVQQPAPRRAVRDADDDRLGDPALLRGAVGGAGHAARAGAVADARSEEHTSELQSLMRISYAVFCLKKKT